MDAWRLRSLSSRRSWAADDCSCSRVRQASSAVSVTEPTQASTRPVGAPNAATAKAAVLSSSPQASRRLAKRLSVGRSGARAEGKFLAGQTHSVRSAVWRRHSSSELGIEPLRGRTIPRSGPGDRLTTTPRSRTCRTVSPALCTAACRFTVWPTDAPSLRQDARTAGDAQQRHARLRLDGPGQPQISSSSRPAPPRRRASQQTGNHREREARRLRHA